MMCFEDLEAWQFACAQVLAVYGLCAGDLLSRDFGLKDQIQRSSVSVMTNIAEGFERTGNKEKLHFYNIARASCGETRSLLYVVTDVYPSLSEQSDAIRLESVRVGKVISGLIRSTQES
jgi:four helix bundle protein